MKNQISMPPLRSIVLATLVAGTLDIVSAFAYGLAEGHGPFLVLIGIASAIWPGAFHAPLVAAVVGLLLHFAIMSVMVVVFAWGAGRLAWLHRRPLSSGALYGLVLWAVMNLVVLPLRWPALFPHLTATGVIEQWFSHIVLVGMPIAWLTQSRGIRPIAAV